MIIYEGNYNMPKNRILVADNNKLNQDLLSAILGNDYDYLYANNGIEVISALEKTKLSILFYLILTCHKWMDLKFFKH